jgi:hypothetical protein
MFLPSAPAEHEAAGCWFATRLQESIVTLAPEDRIPIFEGVE